MKKKFVTKIKKKKKLKLKVFLFLLLFSISFLKTYNYLEKSNIKIDDKDIVKLLLSDSNSHIKVKKKSLFAKVKEIVSTPTILLDGNYKGLVKPLEIKEKKEVIKEVEDKPLIYIYNTHQTEQYAPSSVLEYSVNPTVMVGSYILKEKFDSNNLNTLVEERSVKDLLRSNGWNYNYSYMASRTYLDQVKASNSSIKYFIDLHRDSLPYDRTTVKIGDKTYAKLLFLIGLENPNYKENLGFTEKINNKLNEKYPTLSKGIYKKGGKGVNGVYNQDSSGHTILLECGGSDNKIDEVLNSLTAFSEVFSEVIKTSEG